MQKIKRGPRVTWLVPQRNWTRILKPWTASHWHPEYALASVWIRSYQLAPYLVQKGYDVRCNVLDPLPEVAIFLRRYSEKDVLLAKRLKRLGVRIIVDVVTHYFSPRENTNVSHFLRLIDLADQVWCVSPFLQEISARYHPNTFFVSDSVDPIHFSLRPRVLSTSDFPINIGWSGVAPKALFFLWLTPVLTPLIERGKIHLLIISSEPPDLPFPFEFRRWRYSKFPMDISDCKLCIAPRTLNNEYDKSHSLFKIGVFMAIGVPALASAVPSYNLLLGDGKGGTICESLEQWEYQLSRFIATPSLREEWHQQAQEKMQPFLTPNIAEQINHLLELIS